MGMPTGHQTSQVLSTDTHMVLVPTPGGPVPTLLPHPFLGMVQSATTPTVTVAGQPAATQDSVAFNTPPHLPMPPGVSFQVPPNNQGTVALGSVTVMAGGKPLARFGDSVRTCNFPVPLPVGTLISGAPTVLTG